MTQTLLGSLAKIQGVSFASFVYKAKGSGQTHKYLLILGASTKNLYDKDIDILEDMLRDLAGATDSIEYTAADSILASRRQSLAKGIGNNDAYAHKDTYTHMNNMPGVKIHNETGELYISGLVENVSEVRDLVLTAKEKDFIEKAKVEKARKKAARRPLTIAKDDIRKVLPSDRFADFKLSEVSVAKASGDTLILK